MIKEIRLADGKAVCLVAKAKIMTKTCYISLDPVVNLYDMRINIKATKSEENVTT